MVDYYLFHDRLFYAYELAAVFPALMASVENNDHLPAHLRPAVIILDVLQEGNESERMDPRLAECILISNNFKPSNSYLIEISACF